MNKVDTELFNRLRLLLVDITGNEPEEVFPEAHLEDDLGMNLDEDISRLVEKVNQVFMIDLDEGLVYDELTEAGETVAALAQLIHDELELG